MRYNWQAGGAAFKQRGLRMEQRLKIVEVEREDREMLAAMRIRNRRIGAPRYLYEAIRLMECALS